jgi:hypothetical protein
VLITLEQSTFVDVSHFGIFQEMWKYIGTLQLPKRELLCVLNEGWINPWRGFSEDPTWISARGKGGLCQVVSEPRTSSLLFIVERKEEILQPCY